MRSEYLAELAKILEPPEMTGKPVQVRKAASPRMIELGNVMSAVGSPIVPSFPYITNRGPSQLLGINVTRHATSISMSAKCRVSASNRALINEAPRRVVIATTARRPGSQIINSNFRRSP